MPTADVVVVGAGLAGMTAAIALAEAGATVRVVAAGYAASHWATGPIDVAAPRQPGVRTSLDGVRALAGRPGHPYGVLGEDVPAALEWFAGIVAQAEAGIALAGGLDRAFRPLPTALGTTRPVGLVPRGQAGALPAWAAGERLVVVGIAGFKDAWPDAIAAGLDGPAAWPDDRPAGVRALSVELPGLAGRRNVNGTVLAALFDEPAWRRDAIEAIGRAVDRLAPGGRLALPAVLGLAAHEAVLDELDDRVGRPLIELPLVPPGIPGLRLHRGLAAAFRARGGRLELGERTRRVETAGGAVTAVVTEAATRERRIACGGLVLATGGIAGGGIVGEPDGTLREAVIGLPVEGPPVDDWLAADPLDPAGHPIEAAGVRVDAELRPVGREFANVRVVGALLAGQRPFRERCGDGVAIASGRRAAASLAGLVGATGPADAAGPARIPAEASR